MKNFYGKTYLYKGKIIGACKMRCHLWTVGVYDSSTGCFMKKRLSLPSAEDCQKVVDNFAQNKGLAEV